MDRNLLLDAARRGPSRIALMPIADADGVVVAYEALARYDHGRPDEVFAAAAAAGERTRAELAALAAALGEIDRAGDAKLSVNVSTETLATSAAFDLLAPYAGSLWVEVTEATAATPGSTAMTHLTLLAQRGAVIVADDAGAAFTTPAQILTIEAKVVKLDMALVRDQLDRVHARDQELDEILAVARELGATVVAEGIEVVAEIPTALSLGVDMLQGYGIGCPSTE